MFGNMGVIVRPKTNILSRIYKIIIRKVKYAKVFSKI